ncbi:MAG: hydrogenase expression/formation protein HypE [bacterium]
MPEFLPPAFDRLPTGSRIVLGHGAGGRKMHRLITDTFLKHFGNPVLNALGDAAELDARRGRLAVSTDSFVVRPLFFPGGDIGKLAVCGTVNDLAVSGAAPRWLTVGFILREGLALASLERVCRSLAATARTAGVLVVTGDTKVIERGAEEELYVNTTGIGTLRPRVRLGPGQVRPGDELVINGPLGEHEAAIALARGGYRFRSKQRSDCAALHRLCDRMVRAGGVRMMRDPTRGGLATTLNELAEATGLGFIVDEDRLPVGKAVSGIAALLGLDPLYMANEGKVLAVCARGRAEPLVRAARQDPRGRRSCRIGTVVREPAGVWLRTRLGSLRRLIMLEGEQLPRIC